jgi:2-polyprenyl-3-methyl-5-hydroxy-6-metoxy-1,4-benzoquinol methylase
MGFSACGFETDPSAPPPAVQWEEPQCPLCNSTCASLLLEAPDTSAGGAGMWFPVAQCQDCGLCYTSPRPSENCIGQFYAEGYAPHARANDYRPRKRRRLWRWKRRHDALENRPIHGLGRLLDFGCGNGSFLERMRVRGWIVTGIDASAELVQQLRTQRGLSVVAGSLPHPELGEGDFDVITMRHSLEHVHRPLEVLRAAYRLLAPGGQLIVSAPNIDSLPFKWFGKHWWGLDLPRHLTHFTPDTLQLMLARAGFDVDSVRMIRHTKWLRRSAARALASRAAELPWWQRWLRGRLAASVAMWCAHFARRSDGMVVTAVRNGLPEHQRNAEVMHAGPGRRPFPGDRWRNR